MIAAFQKGDVLLQDIQSTRYTLDGKIRIWWLGQSGFLVQWNGKHILLDPYLSDSLSEKYAGTDKPHVRISEKVIEPGKLNFVDLVTSSHNHTDHLDFFTLNPIFKENPKVKFIIPEANREFVVERCKVDFSFPRGLVAGESFSLSQKIKLTAIPAAHNDLATDASGRNLYLGYILKLGECTLYHSGDTLWYEDLEKTLKEFKVDIAFLPINGNKLERRVAGNLSALEAAELGKEINALVIPHHYHLFAFNTEDPENFVQACKVKNTSYHVLRLGEKLVYGVE